VSYSAGRPIGPEDLLQEAFARAMDGRHCPADITVVKFLAEAMRSIAHGEGEKLEHRLALVSASASEEAGQVAFAFPDASPNAERRMVSNETEAEVRGAILALFADDEHAQPRRGSDGRHRRRGIARAVWAGGDGIQQHASAGPAQDREGVS
jgi:DNA-directed RNA polymerase specialized sigma24 family protein